MQQWFSFKWKASPPSSTWLIDKETLQQLAENLHKLAGRVPDPNPGAAPGAMTPTPPFTFRAKSQHHLGVACELVQYYQTVGRDPTVANM